MGKTETRTLSRARAGWAGVAATDRGVTGVVLPRSSKKDVERYMGSCVPSAAGSAIGARAVRLLRRYFSGGRVTFDLPLDLGHATLFQRAVWKAAQTIPYGETRSYAWVAKRIGRPRAARAVGNALGANPLPVVIPCHRVVGSAGRLGGFTGGLELKKMLLALEAGKTTGAGKKTDRPGKGASVRE